MGAKPVGGAAPTTAPKQSYTREELLRMGARPVASAAPGPATQPLLVEQIARGLGAVGKFGADTLLEGGVGFLKGIADLPREAAALGSDIGSRLGQMVASKPVVGATRQLPGTIATPLTTPTNQAQRIGFGAEKIAEFIAPTAFATKSATALGKAAMSALPTQAVSGAGIVPSIVRPLVGVGSRAVTEAALAGGLTALHEGKADKEAAAAAGIGALFPISAGIIKSTTDVGKALLRPEVSKVIREGINKGIKPYFSSTASTGQRKSYMQKAEEAVAYLRENPPNLVDDATGVSAVRAPKNRVELLSAIEQGKAAIFKQYDDIAKTATEAGARFDAAPIVSKLETLSDDLAYSPSVRQHAKNLIAEISELNGASPSVVQGRIKEMNAELSPFFLGRTDKAKAQIEASVAKLMREQLDASIEAAGGSGYQALKNQYGALSTIERDVARQVAVELRRNPKGLIDFTDIFTGADMLEGIITANPGALVRGAAGKGIKAIMKGLNDPNRYIRNMFEVGKESAPSAAAGSALGKRLLGEPAKGLGKGANAAGPGAAGSKTIPAAVHGAERVRSLQKVIAEFKSAGRPVPADLTDELAAALKEAGNYLSK